MGWFFQSSCSHRKLSPLSREGVQYCIECNKAFLPPDPPPCDHPSHTDVKDGIQYCKVCNKAFYPIKNPIKSQHKLKNIKEQTIITGRSQARQTVTTQQCERCGKLFNYNTTCGEYDSDPSKDQCLQEG